MYHCNCLVFEQGMFFYVSMKMPFIEILLVTLKERVTGGLRRSCLSACLCFLSYHLADGHLMLCSANKAALCIK